jgi:hypothetical protein
MARKGLPWCSPNMLGSRGRKEVMQYPTQQKKNRIEAIAYEQG